ncbi:enoyl-CoA hydratase [Desulfosarcina ovata subsp. sediminis]|uniref:Enoyl-CoA hydratase n=1 Tax=Desulfosarcina ovata subsp. sediminis TaxID=885957 RepID=A0A5K7ZL43_9BACT|nr:enoyl-CoA hydratase/isomerase family protein [Desulfosarcina ovata]BBO80975.1 enoyl-CoA hydratase [Desulfosarcina ovata subsp. sediminis]
METDTILFETQPPIATIILNRPDCLNALNAAIIDGIDQALRRIAADDAIRAVILTGTPKAFAAGADIGEIAAFASPKAVRSFVDHIQKVFGRLADFTKPTIAAVSGFAFGGGCELALCCDIRIAADNARFGLPEIKLGILPGAGGTQRLPRLVGMGNAKRMIYTGDSVDAEAALGMGLVSEVVPGNRLMDAARELATTLAERPAFSLSTIKRLMSDGASMPLDQALAHERLCFETLFATRDQKEGVGAFMEKRTPRFTHC